jgi:protein TonB
MPYRIDPRDRAKSLGLVVAVHVLVGAALLAGLRGPELVRTAREQLTAFDVEAPPPPSPPLLSQEQAAPEEEAGAPDPAAKAAPIVLPTPPRPVPSLLPVAHEAGPVPGADQRAGAGQVAGPGDGAGGSGDGSGGGGSGGAGSGGGQGIGARWIGGGLSRGDYRTIRSFAVPTGSAAYAIRVNANGRAVDCRARSTSGSPDLDAMICDMLLPRLRFEPARDGAGRPRPDEIVYVANWARR